MFDQFDIGKITSTEFRQHLRQLLNRLDLSDQAIDAAWNSILLKSDRARFDFLKTLQNRYTLILFSNANDIHMDFAEKIFARDIGEAKIEKFFDHTYFSHKCGFRKPHASSFQKILDNHNLKAEETLFIDDSMQHIEGAKSIGIQTYLMPSNESIIKHFNQALQQYQSR